MRRYLVVANQTLQRAELADELRKRIEAGPSSFYLLVPDTRAADYPIIVATLPRPVSRWLRADLPHRAERRFGLPVTTIITRRWA
jgi:hypothetical protein